MQNKDAVFDVYDLFDILKSNYKIFLIFSVLFLVVVSTLFSLYLNDNRKLNIKINFNNDYILLKNHNFLFSNFVLLDDINTTKLIEVDNFFKKDLIYNFFLNHFYGQEHSVVKSEPFHLDESKRNFLRLSIIESIDKKNVYFSNNNKDYMNQYDIIYEIVDDLNMRFHQLNYDVFYQLNHSYEKLFELQKQIGNYPLFNTFVEIDNFEKLIKNNYDVLTEFNNAKFDNYFNITNIYKTNIDNLINFRIFTLIFLVYLFLLTFIAILLYGYKIKRNL